VPPFTVAGSTEKVRLNQAVGTTAGDAEHVTAAAHTVAFVAPPLVPLEVETDEEDDRGGTTAVPVDELEVEPEGGVVAAAKRFATCTSDSGTL
jgi:hypothetical protein